MFEEFNKSSVNKANTRPASSAIPSSAPPSAKGPKSKVFYAVVLHDFTAERPDELDAKRGDAISVVAQSNREWFVAKPIDRVGRPGLIPASFVEIRDPATGTAVEDVESLMDRGELPRVEDWKRSVFEYKQNSISLGVIDTPSNSLSNRHTSPAVPSNQSHASANHAPTPQAPESPPPLPTSPQYETESSPTELPVGILLSADVVSFHHEMDDFWFRIDAMYQPYTAAGQSQLPPAKRLILFRVYADFYEFQVALLSAFPREAGRQPPSPRILPFMPGPAEEVDHELTETRRSELNDYLHKLCELNRSGNKYILEDHVVRQFCSLKPGDVENDADPRVQEIEELFGYDQARRQAEEDGYIDPLDERDDEYGVEVRDQLGHMRVNGDKSDGSDYEDEGYGSQHQHTQQRGQEQERHPYQQFERRPSDSSSSKAPHSGNARLSAASSQDRHYGRAGSTYDQRSPLEADASGWTEGPSSNRNNYDRTPSYASGRSRSSSTTHNLNTPPISAANQQAAFVKIKIFDRISDDLIAIRVHPHVSHAELIDKVQTRLGGEVLNLRYRDSFKNDLVVLNGDNDLRAWMGGTEKYVLYAD